MRSLLTKKTKIALALPIAVLLLQGCASTTLSPVSMSKKDTAGAYDGKWMAVVSNTTPIQYLPGNWQITCADRTGEEFGPFIVKNGVASMGKDTSAYVSSKGKFRFEVPIVTRAAASGTSDSSISNDEMTVIMYGSLAKQNGKMIFGIAEFANAGCTSKMKYQKL